MTLIYQARLKTKQTFTPPKTHLVLIDFSKFFQHSVQFIEV